MNAIILIFATTVLALWPARMGAQSEQCEGDFNSDGQVTIDEIVTTVSHALDGCMPPERFVDNGDGTITDNRTGLTWEKKSDDDGIHDMDDVYDWSTGSPFTPNGEVFTTFLAGLNRNPCFTKHCDWRLPSVQELQSLLDYQLFSPAVEPAFDKACTPGCTVLTCSCTAIDYYWTSSPIADIPDNVFSVDFTYGLVNLYDKTVNLVHARAVRGGLESISGLADQ